MLPMQRSRGAKSASDVHTPLTSACAAAHPIAAQDWTYYFVANIVLTAQVSTERALTSLTAATKEATTASAAPCLTIACM